MKNTNKGPFKNKLAQIRLRNRLGQREVAKLLGDRNIDNVVHYEHGIKTPNLKTALKLAHIFDLPIRVMLDGYYAAVRDEIRKEEAKFTKASAKQILQRQIAATVDYCSYEAAISNTKANSKDIAQARRHTSELVRKTAELLGHIAENRPRTSESR